MKLLLMETGSCHNELIIIIKVFAGMHIEHVGILCIDIMIRSQSS